MWQHDRKSRIKTCSFISQIHMHNAWQKSGNFIKISVMQKCIWHHNSDVGIPTNEYCYAADITIARSLLKCIWLLGWPKQSGIHSVSRAYVRSTVVIAMDWYRKWCTYNSYLGPGYSTIILLEATKKYRIILSGPWPYHRSVEWCSLLLHNSSCIIPCKSLWLHPYKL